MIPVAVPHRTAEIVPLTHPQGCRTYLVVDPVERTALAIDVHLDLVEDVSLRLETEGWRLLHVVDTHTHADHPSGSAALADRFGATRIAHEEAHHRGVARHPADGEVLQIGAVAVTIRHAPGHTPDHLVLLAGDALFAGDTLLIGGVARTDFLGGDAGQLWDTLRRVLAGLPGDTVVYPGHDYQGRISTTLDAERATNPWLRMESRAEFVRQLTANPPPRPANMDALIRLNREAESIPGLLDATSTKARLEAGGAGSVIDVRTGMEWEAEHVDGSRHVPLDEIERRADEVRLTPAPRLLLCRTGARAKDARRRLEALHVRGLTVIEGGLEGLALAGVPTVHGRATRISLERQVRIAAGLLVTLGTGLGFVHPAFFAVPAFVGLGLTFAGLTDRCGMALVLAKMPWNEGASAASGPVPSCAASAPSACAASAPSACAAPAPNPSQPA